MSYPDAFCVKCGKHTETLQKHTVILQNQSRALNGTCHDCGSEVFRIMPKKKESKVSDDSVAYCVKCHDHVEVIGRHTVVLGSDRRALKGQCPKCHSDVYKILPFQEQNTKGQMAQTVLSKTQNSVRQLTVINTQSRRPEVGSKSTEKKTTPALTWSARIASYMVALSIVSFVAVCIYLATR